MHSRFRITIRSEHVATNVTPSETEAETFAIKDGIYRATAIEGVHIITNSIQCVYSKDV